MKCYVDVFLSGYLVLSLLPCSSYPAFLVNCDILQLYAVNPLLSPPGGGAYLFQARLKMGAYLFQARLSEAK